MYTLKHQLIRFLSHFSFGKSKEKYKKLWYEIKNEIHDTPKYTTSAIYPLLQDIKSDIKKVYDNLFYQRVPGVGYPSVVHDYISDIIQCSELHKLTFQDKHFLNYGKDVVICATGPSFKYYSLIQNAYHIGVNHSYNAPNIQLDALFCQDVYSAFGGKLPADFITYRGQNCIKFLGNIQPLSLDVNPKDYPILYYMSENKLNYNINYRPLPDYTSVVFSAFAYALWTTPKRIFLVGADCSSGYASVMKVKHSNDASNLVQHWKKMKSFAERFYPDVEIISINPVGLKGLFKDIYTKEFVLDNLGEEYLEKSEIILFEDFI